MHPTASTVPAPPADRRRTDTRRALVRAATGLFRRHGIGTVGVAEICRRAGVAKGVFSHHFPGGKDELVEAVIAANGVEVRARIDAVAARAASRGTSPARAVRAVFDGYAAAMRDAGADFGCPVVAGVVDASGASAAARDAAHAAFSSWRTGLGAVVSRQDAELVVATLEGAIVLARAAGDPSVVARVGRALSRHLAAADG